MELAVSRRRLGPRGSKKILFRAVLLALVAALGARAALAETTRYEPPPCAAELSSASDAALLDCYAPAFEIERSEQRHNRIGTPVASRGWLGGTRVHVDPERPALYAELRRDTLGDMPILQLVYRVHFEKIPLQRSRYFFEAHRNPGLLLVVTLDARTRAPWFVTAVHTCGCYRALIPTGSVPAAWLPESWPADELRIYGQRLPVRLPAFDPHRDQLRARIAPGNHRFEALAVLARAGANPALAEAALRDIPLLPLAQLRSLPVRGRERTASIFYESGPLRGHVRGAWNPLEGLTLFGLVSLDPTVGMDKDFGDPRETGTAFYTLLPFWMHSRSRLDRMDDLLRALGFRLPGAAAS